MDNITISKKATWTNSDQEEKKVEKTVEKKEPKKIDIPIPDISKLDSFITDLKDYYSEIKNKQFGDFLIILESSRDKFKNYIEQRKN